VNAIYVILTKACIVVTLLVTVTAADATTMDSSSAITLHPGGQIFLRP